MLDITERKQVEEELRATNETLQALIDASPLSIVAVDRDKRVTPGRAPSGSSAGLLRDDRSAAAFRRNGARR